MIRFTHLRVPVNLEEDLHRWLNAPNQRRKATYILERESEKIKVIAEETADKELHRRTATRRNSPEPGYHDSFRVFTSTAGTRLRVGVRNEHQSAHWVEYGTKPHDIPQTAGKMRFPFDGPVGQGGVGRLGAFPVQFGDGLGGEWRGTGQIKHPGAGAHRIMRRARDTYAIRNKRILNR